MMDGFEANLLANLFQIATLALGVCLLAVWINYLKAAATGPPARSRIAIPRMRVQVLSTEGPLRVKRSKVICLRRHSKQI
jgi:hypothetical protein